MPLPVVSLDTIKSTLHAKEDADISWHDKLASEQIELMQLLQCVGGIIPDNIPSKESFMLGAVTVYKMIKRQVEAEDLAELI